MTMGSDVPVGSVVLRKGSVRPIHAGHPWIFSRAVAHVIGEPAAGDPVWVVDPKERVLGWGVYSPESKLRVRMWGRDTSTETARLGDTLVQRIESAYERRKSFGYPSESQTAYRLVNAEGDRIPGLMVDVLGDAVAARYGSVALWQRKESVAKALQKVLGIDRIVQLVDHQVADAEGLYGIEHVAGDPDAESCMAEFRDQGLLFSGDLMNAQKTGHYTDQAENRALVRSLSGGKKVLDLCTHTGGFALNASKGGAEFVLGVDSSGPAIKKAETNAKNNKCSNVKFVNEDLVRCAQTQTADPFDLVILDPPKLVKRRNHLDQGLHKYRALNSAALNVVRDGGMFMSFSCSGLVDTDTFLRNVSAAAEKSGRALHIHQILHAGPDHPFMAQAPETNYLKGVLATVTSR